MSVMISSIWTILWTVINILLLYFVLKKILFKPLSKVIEKRQALIQGNLDDADKAKTEANALKAQYESSISSAKEDARKIISDADVRSKKMIESSRRAAAEEAESMKANAKKEIERERKEALDGAKGEIATLALDAASKVLSRNVTSKDNDKIIEDFLSSAKAEK